MKAPGSKEPEALLLRPATPRDLGPIADLEKAIFEPPENRPWGRRQLAEELVATERLFLVAQRRRKVAGYAIFRRLAGEAELLRIACSPKLRRRRIGDRLLAAGLQWLATEAVETCYLEVRADNQAALRLYSRHGFEITGRRPAYYADGCAALLLSRRGPSA